MDINIILKNLRNLFFQKCDSDNKLKNIERELGEGTYETAHEYAIRVGELLSETFEEVFDDDLYNQLDEETIRKVIPSLLGNDHKKVSNACIQVQENLNRQANIGMKGIPPDFDISRAYDLADKYISYDSYEDAKWLLQEPIINFSQSIVDKAVKKNADFQYKSGMNPKIIRTSVGGCCKWCSNLAGKYDYTMVKNTGNDVFKRHENCRCTVTYDPGDGKHGQNVWSKRWLNPEEIQERKQLLAESLRRRISSDGHEIIDKPTYQKLTKDFIKSGGIIIRGEEASKHLEKVNATASYIRGGRIAFIRDDATVSDVIEEMYHAYQDRKGMFNNYPTDEVLYRREIDAQKYLLSLTKRYKIPLEEVEATKTNLDYYESELQALLERKNS